MAHLAPPHPSHQTVIECEIEIVNMQETQSPHYVQEVWSCKRDNIGLGAGKTKKVIAFEPYYLKEQVAI